MLLPGHKSSAERLKDDLHYFVSETRIQPRRLAREASVDPAVVRKALAGVGGVTNATEDKLRTAMLRLALGVTFRAAAAPETLRQTQGETS